MLLLIASCSQPATKQEQVSENIITGTDECVNGILDSFITSGVITSSIKKDNGFCEASMKFKYKNRDAVFYFPTKDSFGDGYKVDSVTLIMLCDGSFSAPRTELKNK